jgi:hypothetical protein
MNGMPMDRISFETLSLGTVVSLAALVQYSVDPTSNMNVFWKFVHPKLYVVTLLDEW